ncbi:MAG: hypothetical protein KC636_15550 [Myxococcales bacterium]|nr:hypothetical protein [Myxococcales bacterium]
MIRRLALALAVCACGPDPDDPVRVAEQFAEAVRQRDSVAITPLLEEAARTRLQAAAEQASDQVGGRRSVEPWEVLQVVDVDPLREFAGAELVDRDDALAHVRLFDSARREYIITLVREGSSWHVRIPTPSTTP